MASDWNAFKLWLAMSASSSSRVWRQAQAVEDRTKCQESREKNSDMEVMELGHGCRVAVRVRDQAQRDGADGDAHPHT
jgi:hypothetical protein